MPLLSFDYEKDVFGEELYAGPIFFWRIWSAHKIMNDSHAYSSLSWSYELYYH